ncbi:MAG: ABC transporter ATP-binding protein [Deltaproteobacteria bacterium]|nr:ABC transporter ATP-binding protein [Deltaproteobacteria bacterium]
MPALSVEALRVSYGDHEVIRGATLAVESGEIVGLIGPNGAGKTTLLRAVAGLIPATGAIAYDGRPLATLSPRERAALRAYVPQQAEQVFPYRVKDVVAMGLAYKSRWYGTPAASEAVNAALVEVGFAAAADTRVDCLSGGERQQVMLARGLVPGGALLLLDEPTSALDLKHRAAAMAALRRRARSGGAVLLSLHDLNLAAVVCHRLLILDAGRVVASGRPEEVIRPEILAPVYGVAVVCGRHPAAAAPTVEIDPATWA